MRRTMAAVLAAGLLVSCSHGSSKDHGSVTATGPASAQVATLDMTDALLFQPNVVVAKIGTLRLTATNTGRVPHNLVFNESRLGATDTISGGSSQTLTLPLSRVGSYTFTCTFHSGMSGRVAVMPTSHE